MSTFGSKFMVLKHCIEYIRGLWFKLRMMGIRISGLALIYGDNQSILANTIGTDSALKKKLNSIAFNFVQEGITRDK